MSQLSDLLLSIAAEKIIWKYFKRSQLKFIYQSPCGLQDTLIYELGLKSVKRRSKVTVVPATEGRND